MPINLHNPFKGRQHPGEVIVLCVRWYLWYPLSYEHVTELVSTRTLPGADGTRGRKPLMARSLRTPALSPLDP